MNIAIIPARGGSQRIPRKNIQPFCGKPIISHSIHAALASNVIDQVVVSTDDEEIATVAREAGAQVPFMRPAELADNSTGTAAVIRHAINTLVNKGWSLNYCACIYATAPLLTADRIRDGLRLLKSSSNASYVFTAARFSFPIQRALLKSGEGGVKPFDTESIMMRSQDLPETFHDAGQLYWGHHSAWTDPTKKVFSSQSRMLVLPDHLVCDIDTSADWKRAEILYQILKQQGDL